MTERGSLWARRRRRSIRSDDIEPRVSDDYRWMTLSIIAVSTIGGIFHMVQSRRLGKRFVALCAMAVAERCWLLWYLGTRPDADGARAIGIDAVTLATGMVLASRLTPAGQYCSPWSQIAGSSTPAYPHLGGTRVGWGGTALLGVGTALGYHLNGRGRRDLTLRGVVDGLAHARGLVLSQAAAASFRLVAERLSDAAARVEAQQAEASAALERERLYGLLHDHTLFALEQISGPEPPDLETARKIARVEEERLRLRLAVADPGEQIPWQSLAEEFSGNGLAVAVDVAPALLDAVWEPEVLSSLVVSVSEALRNVVKHANATRVGVKLDVEGVDVVVEVIDDGAGFDPSTIEHGYGLTHRLRAPVEAAGGAVCVDSAPGHGTTIRIRAPLDT